MTSSTSSHSYPSFAEPVLLALTVVTGLVDAVSYLALGRVFTANMTGNVVLLGFAAAGSQELSVSRSGAALGAFMVGAVVGGRMSRPIRLGVWHRWTSFAFGVEGALFLAAMAVAIGQPMGFPNDAPRVYTIIVLTATAMGMRNATMRSLAVPDHTTTVLTLTLARLAADTRLAGGDNHRWVSRASSVVTMLAGAALGAWFLRYSVMLPLAICTLVSALCSVTVYVSVRHEERSPSLDIAQAP
jgi:uncharacterized membrane protein YoaK (UPF0700 family)